MNVRELLLVLRRRWRVFTGTVLLACVAGLGVSFLQAPAYSATSKVFVSTATATSVSDLSQSSDYSQQIVNSYADVVATPIVLDRVIRQLQLNDNSADLADRVSASAATNTSVLSISVVYRSSRGAADVANAISSTLATIAPQLSPSGNGSTQVKITQIQNATAPLAPTQPRPLLNELIALLVGFAAGIGLVALRESLDTRLHSSRELGDVAQLPILATIPFDRSLRSAESALSGAFQTREAYNALRTALTYALISASGHSVLVTSSVPSEGKTSTAMYLANALSASGASVLVVDADLRKPRIARALGMNGAIGLPEVLIGESKLGDALQRWGAQFDVLPTETLVPNPSELLGSEPMTHLISTLREMYDYVVYDSAPTLAVTDPLVLARQLDGTLLVAAPSIVRRAALDSTLERLRYAEVKIVGLVATKVEMRAQGSYEYYKNEEAPSPSRPASRGKSPEVSVR